MDSATLRAFGKPVLNGLQDSPATAMAAGLAVVQSGATIALAGVGVRPLGFLMNEVTLDGPLFEELEFTPQGVYREVKVSDGKIQVLELSDGVSYDVVGNIEAAVTFAVGDFVAIAPNGEFRIALTTNLIIGQVTDIDLLVGGLTGGFRFKALSQLEAVT